MPVALTIENVFPVDEVTVTVQLSAVPLAALTYGFGGAAGRRPDRGVDRSQGAGGDSR